METTDRNGSSKNRALMDEILTEMVEEYIIPKVAWLSYLFYLNKGDFVYWMFYKNRFCTLEKVIWWRKMCKLRFKDLNISLKFYSTLSK